MNTGWSPVEGYIQWYEKSNSSACNALIPLSMNRQYRLSFLIIIILIFITTGCQRETDETGRETITIKDMIGRIVKVPPQVNRIICIGPGILRLITYLEATDNVVAIEGGFEKESPRGRPYMMAHPELAELPAFGAASPAPQLNPEAILELRPDVVFIAYVEPRIADDLAVKTAIPVIVLSYGAFATFDDEAVFSSLRIAAQILDKTARAEQVINYISHCQQELSDRTRDIKEDKKPRVYIAGLGFKGTNGITSTECRYPLFEILHAANVVNELDQTGHIFVDKEKIIQWNPDIIFIDEGSLNLVQDDYTKNPEFYRLLKAVEKQALYGVLPYNFYTTNLATALANAYYMGKVIYPDAFSDVNPEVKADEIYTFLVGKPVYSQMQQDWKGFKQLRLEDR